MEKQIAPIPAFYACYLLRSVARHSSLYIGSTPNPPRRLRQHNGDAKGGAVRTSRDSLRPWEMTCLLTGFPSKIAALQFEWAWQNPNLTRHIAPESRITQSRMTSRISPKTGRVRKRSARPRLSLTDRLANLHLLLRANSFARWPLKLTFFLGDVYRVWQKSTPQTPGSLRAGISVAMHEPNNALQQPVETDETSKSTIPVGIHALDLGYTSYKDQLSRTQVILGGSNILTCNICLKHLPNSGSATLVCINSNCNAISHLSCLAAKFLDAEGRPNALVPTQGVCSSCGTQLQWVDLVKELSLRMRGEKEIKTLFMAKRAKKAAVAADTREDNESSAEDDHALEMVLDEAPEWHELSESSDDDFEMDRNKGNLSSTHPVFKRKKTAAPYSKVYIEDSDPDDAEILT